jgi:predicted metal-dependent phosphoesterase TrpH
VIDLHVHTTASDGRATPRDVVDAARRAGVRTLAVADHDTVSALGTVAGRCAELGVEWVPGIEITSVEDGIDVHLLGYFIDPAHPALTSFLEAQAADRVRRIREMIDRLRALGLRVDVDDVFAGAGAGGWVGRPLLARALVRQKLVRSTREAFDRYLAAGGAAWVPRRAPSPGEVIAIVHRAGGVVSLAHPGTTGRDEWIPGMAAAGLDAIEVYYPEHSPPLTEHYRALAARLGLAMSGGSDYHGDPAYGPARPGMAWLPAEAYDDLRSRAERSRRAGVACEAP